jgi:hypothetical protein
MINTFGLVGGLSGYINPLTNKFSKQLHCYTFKPLNYINLTNFYKCTFVQSHASFIQQRHRQLLSILQVFPPHPYSIISSTVCQITLPSALRNPVNSDPDDWAGIEKIHLPKTAFSKKCISPKRPYWHPGLNNLKIRLKQVLAGTEKGHNCSNNFILLLITNTYIDNYKLSTSGDRLKEQLYKLNSLMLILNRHQSLIHLVFSDSKTRFHP